MSASGVRESQTTHLDDESLSAGPRTFRLPEMWVRILVPLGVGIISLLIWELVIGYFQVPPYVMPGPVAIFHSMVSDWNMLAHGLWVTLQVTVMALLAAVVLGVLLAGLMTQSKWLEMSFFPYMIIMQVTPIIAVAPLVILWVNNLKVGLLICAWLIAFFPIVANTITGLKSVDHNLESLFRLYGASRIQTFWYLGIPSAMPYFLAGLRISGGLALVGAVAAEFVAGSGGQGSGLAFRILEAGYSMNIPRMFAALSLISVAGLAIHLILTYVSHLCLYRWHESAVKREQ
jgi:NitT/TauT family transport system permease protein